MGGSVLPVLLLAVWSLAGCVATTGTAMAPDATMAHSSVAAAPAPEDVVAARDAVDRFLLANKAGGLRTPQGRDTVSGELRDGGLPTLGDIPEPDKFVAQADGTVVARLASRGDREPDVYLYVRRSPDGDWRVDAARFLVVPLARIAWAELRAMPSRDFRQERQYRNFNLMLRPDRELIAWFRFAKGGFETLRGRAMQFLTVVDEPRYQQKVTGPDVEALLQSLDARALLVDAGPMIFVLVGGILDNSVGFLHAPDGKVPPMDGQEYIWVEPIEDGWYLYKTT